MFSSCNFISALKLLNVDSARARSPFNLSNINTTASETETSSYLLSLGDKSSLYLLFGPRKLREIIELSTLPICLIRGQLSKQEIIALIQLYHLVGIFRILRI